MSLKYIVLLFLAFPVLNEANISREILPPIPNITRFENGTIIRHIVLEFVPPQAQVITKDVSIPPLNIVSARLFKPINTNRKLPLLIHVHGGGYYTGTAFSSGMDSYLKLLVIESHVIVASIEYRLAPEHPIPACYDDVWDALKWFVSTSDEPWIDSADLSRMFLVGESAGGNIIHDTMVRASREDGWLATKGVKIVGMALVHPHFSGSVALYYDNVWLSFCPHNSGLDDPRLNPAAHPSLLRNLTCSKILLCTATKDIFLDKAWTYYAAMKRSGWPGQIRAYETQGEGHVFHLVNNQTSPKAILLMKRMAKFFN